MISIALQDLLEAADIVPSLLTLAEEDNWPGVLAIIRGQAALSGSSQPIWQRGYRKLVPAFANNGNVEALVAFCEMPALNDNRPLGMMAVICNLWRLPLERRQKLYNQVPGLQEVAAHQFPLESIQ